MFWFAIATYWAVGASLCAAAPQPQTLGLETVSKRQPGELKIASMMLHATISRGVENLYFTVNETSGTGDTGFSTSKLLRQHFCGAANSRDPMWNNEIESDCVEVGTAIGGDLSVEKVEALRDSQDYQQPPDPLLFRLTTVEPPLGFRLNFRFDNADRPWSEDIFTVAKEWNCDKGFEEAVCVWQGTEEKRFIE